MHKDKAGQSDRQIKTRRFARIIAESTTYAIGNVISDVWQSQIILKLSLSHQDLCTKVGLADKRSKTQTREEVLTQLDQYSRNLDVQEQIRLQSNYRWRLYRLIIGKIQGG